MSYKKTACIVLVVGVVIALILLGVSKIHITKKSQKEDKTTTEAVTTSIDVVSVDDTASETTTELSTEVATTEEPVASNNSWQEVNEASLDYSKDVQSVSGSVTAKKIYSTGSNQLVYDVEITSTLGNSKQVFNYYCTYNTFNELKEKDLVLVEYKQVGEKNFVVCSLSK